MQLNLRMLYATDNVVAFQIDDDIYYLMVVEGVPVIFDGNMNKLIMSNFDNWLQANTGQRVGRQIFFDMVTIFRQGMHCGCPPNHIINLIRDIVIETKSAIFQTALSTSYSAKYSIEILDIHRLTTSFADHLVSNFNKLLEKMGHSKLYDYLCRCVQVCEYNSVDPTIFRKLIKKLGKEQKSPKYPETVGLDNILMEIVTKAVFEKKGHMPYNVSREVAINVEKLEGALNGKPNS